MGHLQQNKKLEKIGLGDHTCLLFDHMNQYREIATNFIIDGLLNNEKVLCVINEYPLYLLSEDLKSKNIDVEYFIENGQLIITSNEKVYYSSNSFNPITTIEYWKQQLNVIEKESFNGFRVMGEIVFATDGKLDSFDKLMEYELLFNKEVLNIYDKHTYLCILNKSKFPLFVLEDMIKKHNVVINGEKLFKPNPYYIDVDHQLQEYNQKLSLRNRFSLDTNTYDNKINDTNKKKNKDIEILKHVLGATGDGIWELDIQTSKIDLSETFYDIIGQVKNETNNDYRNIIKLIHPEDLYEFMDLSEKCLKNEIQYFNYELRVKSKNGEWVWILVKGLPIKKNAINGQVLKMVGIFNNITESKRIKIELDEKIYYEKLRTDFFANLSHEFRTPLNVILGSIQLQELYINNDMSNNNGDKYRKSMKIMKQNCYRLLRLVNNLIDITKIDTGFYDMELQNYDILNLIREIVFSVEDYVTKQKLNIKFKCNVNNLIITCDPEKIERVMLNLLSNAIKFTECGGRITVEVIENNDHVDIIVEDTGLGIPENKLYNIFDRFSQIDKSLTRNHEGSGIGLSLVKSIVEMHKGKVYVESKINKGSKFIIKLPLIVTNKDIDCNKQLAETSITNVERMHIEFADIYSRE